MTKTERMEKLVRKVMGEASGPLHLVYVAWKSREPYAHLITVTSPDELNNALAQHGSPECFVSGGAKYTLTQPR